MIASMGIGDSQPSASIHVVRMPNHPFIQLLPYLVSILISGWVGLACWRRQGVQGARAYAWVAFSQAIWTSGYLCETLSPGLRGKIFWDDFQYFGVIGWTIGFTAFSYRYSLPAGTRMPWGRIAAVTGIGMLLPILSFSDPWHHLARQDPRLVPGEPFAGLTYGFTMPILLLVLIGYLFFLAAFVRLILRFRSAQPLYRHQVAIVILGNAIPVAATILPVFAIIQGPGRDLSPYTFAIGNLLVGWALIRFRLFGIVPLARSAVVEHQPDAVLAFDAQGLVLDFNPAAARLFENSRQRLSVGIPVGRALAPWDDLSRILAILDEADEGGGEIDLPAPGGVVRLDARVSAMRGSDGARIGGVVVLRDVTALWRAREELAMHRDHLEDLVRERTLELTRANRELRSQIGERVRLEERLRQAHKMEAIGRLAGGIAHDFNNLLVPILGFAELGLLQVDRDSPLKPQLEEIRGAARRAADLTSQILAFSRQQVLALAVQDLNAVVASILKILRQLVGEGIEILARLEERPIHVRVDRAQLEQVLTNLAANARDAMLQGGRLSIAVGAGTVTESARSADARLPPPGEYALLVVADDGCGMPREVLDRIFDPFYTTKPTGKGTGLGLATVFGIVEQHGGRIAVDSDPGAGTRFRIWLPLAPADSRPLPEASPREASMTRGSERVVIIEDDAAVRQFVSETLRLHGYVVEDYAAPEVAIESVGAQPEHPDLLIADVVMPGLSGRETYRRLRGFVPGLRVLFISGYAAEMIAERSLVGSEGFQYLGKPFSVDSLLREVRRALASD